MTVRLEKNKFIEKASQIHENKFDYSNSIYSGYNYPITFKCIKHNKIITISFARNLLSKKSSPGCDLCRQEAVENMANKKTKSQDKFIEQAKKIHGDTYGYDKVNYKKAHLPIDIFCKIHNHYFPLSPNKHLMGKGCQDCGYEKLRLDTEEFIERASKIHNNFYNYDKVNYETSVINIEIICPNHKSFWMTPNNHLAGQGCRRCSSKNKFRFELRWLNYLNIPDDNQHRQVCIPIKDQWFFVDGFDPDTNTIYEFYGDYWHGNPNNIKFKSTSINKIKNKTFKELYEETIKKEIILKENGYKLITIWESDFCKQYGRSRDIE